MLYSREQEKVSKNTFAMAGTQTPAKSVFITGAAAGIGRAAAQRFAAQGWYVGLYDVNAAAVRELAAELGPGRALAGSLDVSDAQAFADAVAEFTLAAGRLDLLINNAGVLVTGDFESHSAERYQWLIDINTRGVVNGCLAASPHLKPGARVINMCSASALYGTPAFAVYSASKFFVRGLTEALNIEWQRRGILVMDLMPLFVATPMVAGVSDKPKSIDRLGVRLSAEDVAATLYSAATRSAALCPVHWPVGLQTQAVALLQKLTPNRLYRWSQKLITGY
jgi:NAD(P)-dependent dehydrogenase (short-subunit alcohol dehydrogenase family)